MDAPETGLHDKEKPASGTSEWGAEECLEDVRNSEPRRDGQEEKERSWTLEGLKERQDEQLADKEREEM